MQTNCPLSCFHLVSILPHKSVLRIIFSISIKLWQALCLSIPLSSGAFGLLLWVVVIGLTPVVDWFVDRCARRICWAQRQNLPFTWETPCAAPCRKIKGLQLVNSVLYLSLGYHMVFKVITFLKRQNSTSKSSILANIVFYTSWSPFCLVTQRS